MFEEGVIRKKAKNQYVGIRTKCCIKSFYALCAGACTKGDVRDHGNKLLDTDTDASAVSTGPKISL